MDLQIMRTPLECRNYNLRDEHKKHIASNQILDPTWTTPDFEGNV
jgi:hypothetical protein